MERRHWSLAAGLGPLLLHGPFAMEHERTKANRKGPRPPRRVVIEHHAADARWANRALPMRAPGRPAATLEHGEFVRRNPEASSSAVFVPRLGEISAIPGAAIVSREFQK